MNQMAHTYAVSDAMVVICARRYSSGCITTAEYTERLLSHTREQLIPRIQAAQRGQTTTILRAGTRPARDGTTAKSADAGTAATGTTTGTAGGSTLAPIDARGRAGGDTRSRSRTGGRRGIEGGTGTTELPPPPPAQISAEDAFYNRLEYNLGCPSFIRPPRRGSIASACFNGAPPVTPGEAATEAVLPEGANLSPIMRDILAACPEGGTSCDASAVAQRSRQIYSSVAEIMLRQLFQRLEWQITRPIAGQDYMAILTQVARRCGNAHPNLRSVALSEARRLEQIAGQRVLADAAGGDSSSTPQERYHRDLVNRAQRLAAIDAEVQMLLEDFVNVSPDYTGDPYNDMLTAWGQSPIGQYVPCRTVFDMGQRIREAVQSRRSRSGQSACVNERIGDITVTFAADGAGAVSSRRAREAQALEISCSTTARTREECMASCAGRTRGYEPSQADRLLHCQPIPQMDAAGRVTVDETGAPQYTGQYGSTVDTRLTQADRCRAKNQRVQELLAEHAQIRASYVELDADVNGQKAYRRIQSYVGAAGRPTDAQVHLAFQMHPELESAMARYRREQQGCDPRASESCRDAPDGILGQIDSLCQHPEEATRHLLANAGTMEDMLSCYGDTRAVLPVDPQRPVAGLPRWCSNLRENAWFMCMLSLQQHRRQADEAFSQRVSEAFGGAMDLFGCATLTSGIIRGVVGGASRAIARAAAQRAIMAIEVEATAMAAAAGATPAQAASIAASVASTAESIAAGGVAGVGQTGARALMTPEARSMVASAAMAAARQEGVTLAAAASVEASLGAAVTQAALRSSAGTALRAGAGSLANNVRTIVTEPWHAARSLFTRDPQGFQRALAAAARTQGATSAQAARLSTLPLMTPHQMLTLGFTGHGVLESMRESQSAQEMWRRTLTDCYSQGQGCEGVAAARDRVRAALENDVHHVLGATLIGMLIPSGGEFAAVQGTRARLHDVQARFNELHDRVGILRTQAAEATGRERTRLERELRTALGELTTTERQLVRETDRFRQAYLEGLGDQADMLVRVGDQEIPLSELLAQHPDLIFDVATAPTRAASRAVAAATEVESSQPPRAEAPIVEAKSPPAYHQVTSRRAGTAGGEIEVIAVGKQLPEGDAAFEFLPIVRDLVQTYPDAFEPYGIRAVDEGRALELPTVPEINGRLQRMRAADPTRAPPVEFREVGGHFTEEQGIRAWADGIWLWADSGRYRMHDTGHAVTILILPHELIKRSQARAAALRDMLDYVRRRGITGRFAEELKRNIDTEIKTLDSATALIYDPLQRPAPMDEHNRMRLAMQIRDISGYIDQPFRWSNLALQSLSPVDRAQIEGILRRREIAATTDAQILVWADSMVAGLGRRVERPTVHERDTLPPLGPDATAASRAGKRPTAEDRSGRLPGSEEITTATDPTAMAPATPSRQTILTPGFQARATQVTTVGRELVLPPDAPVVPRSAVDIAGMIPHLQIFGESTGTLRSEFTLPREQIQQAVAAGLPEQIHFDEHGRAEFTIDYTDAQGRPIDVGYDLVLSVDEFNALKAQYPYSERRLLPITDEGQPSTSRGPPGRVVTLPDGSVRYMPDLAVFVVGPEALGSLRTSRITVIIQLDPQTRRPRVLSITPGDPTPSLPRIIRDAQGNIVVDTTRKGAIEQSFWRERGNEHGFVRVLSEEEFARHVERIDERKRQDENVQARREEKRRQDEAAREAKKLEAEKKKAEIRQQRIATEEDRARFARVASQVSASVAFHRLREKLAAFNGEGCSPVPCDYLADVVISGRSVAHAAQHFPEVTPEMPLSHFARDDRSTSVFEGSPTYADGIAMLDSEFVIDRVLPQRADTPETRAVVLRRGEGPDRTEVLVVICINRAGCIDDNPYYGITGNFSYREIETIYPLCGPGVLQILKNGRVAAAPNCR
jgi:hypothetical protein